MSNMRLPKHAQLPLWKDRTPLEKKERLVQLARDLQHYSSEKGTSCSGEEWPPLLGINPSDATSLEGCHAKLMLSYSEVLARPLSNLRLILAKATPFDQRERESLDAMKSLVEAHPNILNMNCEAGHITGSALVVDPTRRRVLLHHHRKLNAWFQFGGHPDFEIEILDVALREAIEESGLTDLLILNDGTDPPIPVDFDLQMIPASSGRPAHIHADLRFIFSTRTPESVKASQGESEQFWWLNFEDALAKPQKIICPSLKRLIAKARDLIDKKNITSWT